MTTICTFFGALFNRAPKVKQPPENGACQRCSNPIAPYDCCCIVGYDSKKHSHPKDLCDQIICYKCTKDLGFEINAIHGDKNQSMPALLFSKEDVEELQRIHDKLQKDSRSSKKKKKKKRRRT